jgi:hypothetical protein
MMHPAILPDASFSDQYWRRVCDEKRKNGLMAARVGNQHLIHRILELRTLLFHGLDREVIDRNIFFFQMLDLVGQGVVFVKHLAKVTVRVPQRLHYIQKFGELAVKLMVLDLHDRALPLFLATRPGASMVEKNNETESLCGYCSTTSRNCLALRYCNFDQ